ncbi:Uncharacterised protein [Weissella viridescens]|uniref:Uncharacterized protein n=1 Tax=Weissella viridescens TaxID=1629 RepID=A0A380NZK8_WEIVI|nr:Uncharacterised protein [Weissella viridescens]
MTENNVSGLNFDAEQPTRNIYKMGTIKKLPFRPKI